MSDSATDNNSISPFHAGEQRMQTRAGKRDAMERFGKRVIRPFMTAQHRDFFAQLPFMVAGAIDAQGWPWAGLLSGPPGFMQSPDETTLHITVPDAREDPVRRAIRPGAPIGLLGIEMPSRRRNRLNGHISDSTAAGFSVTVDQSFGNCPQYIQHREVKFVREPGTSTSSVQVEPVSDLDDNHSALISGADMFFVSSYVQPQDNPVVEGVDVSHRGGRPGFVKVDGNRLTVPDFPGNNHFNTLGNFLINPKAGLVFIDFSTGDVLQLTGRVELLREDHPEVTGFKGAERAWRFTLDHGIFRKDALPLRAVLGNFSPNSLLTDTWRDAAARQATEARRDLWREFRIARTAEESTLIRSFYLEPVDGNAVLPSEAGQFLTIRVRPEDHDRPMIRTYTLSSAPSDAHYRISVKREAYGLVSRHLHDALGPGDVIEVKAPRGTFVIDAAQTRPAVLIAGGVGITPMMAMARHIAVEGFRTRHLRPLTIIHSARTTQERAFAGQLRALEQQTEGRIRYFPVTSQPDAREQDGKAFNGTGRISADMLRQILPLDDYDFMLCGPAPFMQGLYEILRDLGVRDARIEAESFGPAALKRYSDAGISEEASEPEADEAVVSFTRSGFEQRWNAGDPTLLELAEAHGLSPEFSCRGGSCGSCAVKCTTGTVAYRTRPTAAHSEDEVLICCAVPAQGNKLIELEL